MRKAEASPKHTPRYSPARSSSSSPQPATPQHLLFIHPAPRNCLARSFNHLPECDCSSRNVCSACQPRRPTAMAVLTHRPQGWLETPSAVLGGWGHIQNLGTLLLGWPVNQLKLSVPRRAATNRAPGDPIPLALWRGGK